MITQEESHLTAQAKDPAQDWIVPFKGKPDTQILTSPPAMAGVFLKAIAKGLAGSRRIKPDTQIIPNRLVLEHFQIDPAQLTDYCRVCGFEHHSPSRVPIPYFQPLFVALLGSYITSDLFPLNPLGLIHISQSLEQFRPVKPDERLTLTCELSGMRITPKGIHSEFLLKADVETEPVWQGVSVFLTKTPQKQKPVQKSFEPPPFEPLETFQVPKGTGRAYAGVSGDYNPHHISNILAKLFGFKTAIVHGMWSLARVVAGLEQFYTNHDGIIRIHAAFKKPIFMPARVVLGLSGSDENTGTHFILQDEPTGIPHIAGHLLLSSKDDT